ncbi:hypothetical protein GCM10010212_22390 [Paenarthrobacter nicotinovorans]|nr:hypothetical protein [Paenarthrobacter nicotinovorans]GGV33858.1 hypothetical protein GCM10010212_22390 [Paenarthrobacter nicotinovorans]
MLETTVIHTAAVQAAAARMDNTKSTASSCEVFTAAFAQAALEEAEASEAAAFGGNGCGLRAAARARLKSQ